MDSSIWYLCLSTGFEEQIQNQIELKKRRDLRFDHKLDRV